MSGCMRTTLSLDDDVAALLKRLRATTKASFKELVNNALREGLQRATTPPLKRKRFETTAASLGSCYLPDLDDIPEVLAAGEGENFR
jgi:Arc/MetJ family transcription regulator